MSLSNPNKPVTEQRLSEFYQGILPYLGGMPEMLANKFAKGDLYSTNEKMIGQWIDGKPLYQKTIKMPFTKNWEPAYQWSEIGMSNLDYVQKPDTIQFHYVNGSDDFWFNEHYKTANDWGSGLFDSSGFRIGTSYSVSVISEVLFTVQYTKTTDSAIEIGSDTDYSTTEKIVGTWIDGKPIYQKTIILPDYININSPAGVTIASVSQYDIETLVDCVYYGLPKNDDISTKIYRRVVFPMETNLNTANQTLIAAVSGANTWVCALTIQYTKTTD